MSHRITYDPRKEPFGTTDIFGNEDDNMDFDTWYGEVIAHCIAQDIDFSSFSQEDLREDYENGVMPWEAAEADY